MEMSEMPSLAQVRYSYLLTVAGVALMAVSTAYGAVRAMMFRASFRGNFTGARQFGGGSPFGIENGLTILALIVAIVGVVWLGFALRSRNKAP